MISAVTPAQAATRPQDGRAFTGDILLSPAESQRIDAEDAADRGLTLEEYYNLHVPQEVENDQRAVMEWATLRVLRDEDDMEGI